MQVGQQLSATEKSSDIHDRPRKDTYINRLYQLRSFHNGNLDVNNHSDKECARRLLTVAAMSATSADARAMDNLKSKTVSVVVSSSVGRHVSLWGRKQIKVNRYVQLPTSLTRTKTDRVAGEFACTHALTLRLTIMNG